MRLWALILLFIYVMNKYEFIIIVVIEYYNTSVIKPESVQTGNVNVYFCILLA